MAKDDEHAARRSTERASLAEALAPPLEAGSLEAALHAARAFQMRHPGDGDAKRVVEALELLMSQIWLGGDEDDARYAEAAQHLGGADLAAARAQYTAILREDPTQERASRLALRIDVVRCARAGAVLPPPEDAPAPAAAPVVQDESTRVAADGELPLGAFQYDDETLNLEEPLVPPEAFPEEPTRQLQVGEYQLVDEPPKETTRVAQPGELPLEKIRSEMEREQSDAELDLLLDEMESGLGGPDASAAEPATPRSTDLEQREPSLELDLDDELEDEEADAPTEVGSSRSFPRPKREELAREPRTSPSRTFAKPAEEPVLSPPPMVPSEPPAAPRYDSSEPPPPVAIPPRERLSEEATHAPVGTKELALPEKGGWSIREPGSAAEPPSTERPSSVLDSWAGVRVYENEPATFEPGVEGMDVDSWEDPTEIGAVTPEQQAEAAVAIGDLGEALRIYQDLATQSPDDQRLWDRVAEIARMLQERSSKA